MYKLFTHTDLDGIGCAVLATIAFENNVEINYCNYDDINKTIEDFIDSNNDINGYDHCFITDIKITEELAEIINNKYTNFVLLDHHPTALNLNKYNWCHIKIDNEKLNIKTSGTEIFYDFLIDSGYLKKTNILDKFVSVVRDYDTWRWSTIENGIICKQINELFYLYGREIFITWCISKINNNTFPSLYEKDKFILDLRQKEINEYIVNKNKQMFISCLNDKTFGVVFAENFISELGNELCKMHPEIDFIAIINTNGTVSYRTIKDDIDLGNDIAKLFGGGGHPKAAGSSFDKHLLMNFADNIFKNKNEMSTETKQFIDALIKNTRELSTSFERTNETLIKTYVDFVYKFVLEFAINNGYDK